MGVGADNMQNNLLTPSKILVVEDEVIVAKDIKASLQSLGYTVPVAASGEEAIKKAAELSPDLVLMDIRLKGDIDGIEAAEQIYTRFRIPIIYLTAHSDGSTLHRAKTIGAFGYILKPFAEQDLLTTIETALYRYQLEKKLKESEKWWSTTLRSVGDAVIATDTLGRVKFLNPVAEALTGWQQDEALGRDVTEVFSIINEKTRTLSLNPVIGALQQGVIVSLEEGALLISKNKAEIPIDDSAAPIKDDKGNIMGTVVVFRDSTERKQAQESRLAIERVKQLETRMAEIQRVNQLKDDFLSTISHELRTPLTNIKMATEMLEVTLNKALGLLAEPALPLAEREQLVRYLQILNDECKREFNLINDLLDLQRLEAPHSTLELETIHLQSWLPQVIQPWLVRTQKRQQVLQVNFDPTLPPLVCNRSSLERMLTELLNNACKYTPAKEQITVKVSVQSDIMQFRVCNSGVEIPANELARIFDKFYRVPSTDSWKQGGTGLGLALVQKLVKHLGGSIQVESDCAQTCFTVDLPSGGVKSVDQMQQTE